MDQITFFGTFIRGGQKKISPQNDLKWQENLSIFFQSREPFWDIDMARYGPFNNPQKIVGSCNLGNFGNFWHEMANSKIAKSVI